MCLAKYQWPWQSSLPSLPPCLLQGQDLVHVYHESPSPKHLIIIFVVLLRAFHSSGRSQSNVRSERTTPAVPQLSLFLSSGIKVPPPLSVSFPPTKTILLFYCTNHFRRTPVFNLGPHQAFSLGGSRRSHNHRLQVDPVKASTSLQSLSHTHTELNPHVFPFTCSVLSVFCHWHQELHVLKHL